MTTLIAIATLAVATVALWIRRDTWNTRWDAGATLNVALQSVNVALLSPRVSWHLSPRLHTVTGMWNVEDLIGHLAYLGGLAALMYMAVIRVRMTDDQRRRYFKRRLELPATLFLPLLVGCFVVSGCTDGYVVGLLFVPVTPALACYWLLFIAGAVYLLANTIWALLILRHDPRSVRVVDMYLGAIGISLCSFVTAAASFAIDGLDVVTWLLIRAELVGYAVVAAYSWHLRVTTLRGRGRVQPTEGADRWRR